MCGRKLQGSRFGSPAERHSVKWNPVPAEAENFQVCPSSLGQWVGALSRKAEEGVLYQVERVGASDLKEFFSLSLMRVWRNKADEVGQMESRTLCT